MSDEIEITSQELQKILLTALECLNIGTINKATADRITDRANFVVNAMRATREHEAGYTRRGSKVSMAVWELREAEDMLARLSKPSHPTRDARTRRSVKKQNN
jgi:hypothetical protein